MSFKSEVKIDVELLEGGDLKVKFNSECLDDLTIKRAGVPKEKIGAEARELLAASLAECMCSTLIFLLDWAKVKYTGFGASAHVATGKDEKGSIHVENINLAINLKILKDEENLKKFKRAESLFKKGCLMSRSLQRGIKTGYSITI
jgi:organic hydroperoxide reductase OsmC/OhrA